MCKNKLVNSAFVVLLALVVVPSFAQGAEVTVKVTRVALAKSDTLKYTNKVLLKFDLPSVLTESRIDYAELHFRSDFDSTLKYMGIIAHPVTADWTENDTLSDQEITYHSGKLSFMALKPGTAEDSLDITRLVKAWVSGALPNKGIILKPLDKPDKALNISPLGPDMKAEVQIFYTGPEKK